MAKIKWIEVKIKNKEGVSVSTLSFVSQRKYKYPRENYDCSKDIL